MEAKLNTEKTDWTEFPYLEGENDVISVQRGPRPGGVGGAYRAFGETLRGLRTTFGRVLEGPVTIQYPEEKTPVYPRFRGRHKLHRFEDSGLEKCVGCSLCAAACPADCIRVVAAENDPDHRVSAGERYAEVYEINLSRCIFCGYCEVACPFDAITMGHDYEMSDYNRSDLIFTKEMLLAEPIDRTPLRRRASDEESELLKAFGRRSRRGIVPGTQATSNAHTRCFRMSSYRLSPRPEARVLQSRDEVVAFFEDFQRTFPDAQTASHEFIEGSEGTVIVGFRVREWTQLGAGTEMRSGRSGRCPTSWPLCVTEFTNREDALNTAGVMESSARGAE